MSDIHYLSLLDVSGRIRRRELTSVAVTEALLERIDRHELNLNSILMLLADSALEQARQADAEIEAGQWRGPLHGVPIGNKDTLWTKGLPTTAGMAIHRNFRPSEDATAVAKLKQAGAVIIAKLHTTESAMWEHHPAFPRPVNPWSAEHWTGVSSSGSGVAVAAGFCFGATATDLAGSIRLPSSANNLTGIKPTWGRVSRYGLMYGQCSYDHVGPVARSAGDAAAMLQAMAGEDPRDPTCLVDPVPDYLAQMEEGVSGMTLSIDWNFVGSDMAPEILAALEQAIAVFEKLGMRVRDVAFPEMSEEVMTPLLVATALGHAQTYPAKADEYGPDLRTLLDAGLSRSGFDVVAGTIACEAYRGEVCRLFMETDFVIAPGIGRILPTWETLSAAGSDGNGYDPLLTRFTLPFNAARIPTISLPGGFAADGLPIGIQLAGPALSEPALVRAGVAFQNETDFHTRHPPLD